MFKRHIERLVQYHLYSVKRKIELLEIMERAASERQSRQERLFHELLKRLDLKVETHRCPANPEQIVKVKK
jgi:hypothetical protein